MPIVMPMITDQVIAHTVSQNVGMKRSAISELTGRLVRSDRPKSPRTTPPAKRRNCSRQRLVEAQVLAHQRDGLRRGVLPGGEARRVAGQQVHEHEHQDADDEQRRNQAQQTFGEVLEQRVAAVCRRIIRLR